MCLDCLYAMIFIVIVLSIINSKSMISFNIKIEHESIPLNHDQAWILDDENVWSELRSTVEYLLIDF